MELKPGYKLTEVGVIPEDWEVRKLHQEIEKLQTGVSVNSVNEELQIYEGSQYILKTSSVSNGYFIPKECKRIAYNDLSRARLNPRINTIIISRMNTPALVGECGYVNADYPYLFLPDRLWMTYFYKSSQIHVRWLTYLLSSKKYKAKLKDVASGTSGSMKNISKNAILDIDVPIPPFPEQQAIAAALGRTDELLATQERLLARQRELKQALMQQLLTSQIRLPGFSGEWEIKRIGDIFEFLGTANNPRSDLSNRGDIKYIHYGDIHTKWVSFVDCTIDDLPFIQKEKVINVPFLQNGDLVMADASEDYEGIGISVEVKNITGDKVVAGLHTFLLRADKQILVDGFKGYLQYFPDFKASLRKVATGISVYGISKANVQNIFISLPSVEEQKAITEVLTDIDQQIEVLEKERAKVRAVKEGQMQELLTGKTRLVYQHYD